MTWIIVAAIGGLIVGVIIGLVWANVAMTNVIGRHFGW